MIPRCDLDDTLSSCSLISFSHFFQSPSFFKGVCNKITRLSWKSLSFPLLKENKRVQSSKSGSNWVRESLFWEKRAIFIGLIVKTALNFRLQN